MEKSRFSRGGCWAFLKLGFEGPKWVTGVISGYFQVALGQHTYGYAYTYWFIKSLWVAESYIKPGKCHQGRNVFRHPTEANLWPVRAIYSCSGQEIRLVTLHLKAHTPNSDQQLSWRKSHHPGQLVPSGHVRGSPSNTYKQQCLCVPMSVSRLGWFSCLTHGSLLLRWFEGNLSPLPM